MRLLKEQNNRVNDKDDIQIMEKQMGGGKRKMRGKDWAEMYILESGEEGYSAEFIGV